MPNGFFQLVFHGVVRASDYRGERKPPSVAQDFVGMFMDVVCPHLKAVWTIEQDIQTCSHSYTVTATLTLSPPFESLQTP